LTLFKAGIYNPISTTITANTKFTKIAKFTKKITGSEERKWP
jgi:hypothetical protein